MKVGERERLEELNIEFDWLVDYMMEGELENVEKRVVELEMLVGYWKSVWVEEMGEWWDEEDVREMEKMLKIGKFDDIDEYIESIMDR